jgi:hypothetical protein
MKPARTVAARDEGWAALEALVLAELDSLQPAPPKRAPAPHAEATSRPRDRARVTPLRRMSAPPGADSLDASVEAQAAGEQTRGAAGLASVEEQAFITRAVAFLSEREHADIILGRVWEQLLELAPEGFYEPPPDPATAAAEEGGSDAREAGAASAPAGDDTP